MSLKKSTKVIGISSGKGGVGKTTVSVNIAAALVKQGLDVLLLDGDLGLANVQLALGVASDYNFSHVLSGDKTLDEVVVKTSSGVDLVPGASGLKDLASLSEKETGSVIQAFSSLTKQYDLFIIDTAAGISTSVVSLLGACHHRIIVLKDDPSSIADAYATIKVLFLEGITQDIYLLPNEVTGMEHGNQLFRNLNKVIVKFLGFEASYAGFVKQDDAIPLAWKKALPIVSCLPNSQSAREFRNLANFVNNLSSKMDDTGGLQFFFNQLHSPDRSASLGG